MKTRNLFLVSLLLIGALAALIALLTVPEGRTDTAVFWIAFIFSIPLNFLASAALTVLGFGKSDDKPLRIPATLYSVVIFIFGFVLLLAGFLFMYLDVVDVTWPIIVFAALTVFYIILVAYCALGTGYIASIEGFDRKKRLFVKMLEVDLIDCAAIATNTLSQEAIRSFADRVRFSDPMSHASLSGMESDISTIVHAISAELKANPDADVTDKIADAERLLTSRNNRCLMLK